MLTPRGLEILEHGLRADQFRMDNTLTPYISFRDVFDPGIAAAILAGLEAFWPVMKNNPMNNPMTPVCHFDMELDYAAGPYCADQYQMTCNLAGIGDGDEEPEKEAFFMDSGLFNMSRSTHLKRLLEQITGYELEQDVSGGSGILMVAYAEGGYVSPHTDVKWPRHMLWTTSDAPIAYLDAHLAFSTDAVAEHRLIYQQGAHLNGITPADEPHNGALSVYRLPLWHATTPLIAKPGRGPDAHRWVLMLNFKINGDNSPKRLF
jgi:hypothetical protein